LWLRHKEHRKLAAREIIMVFSGELSINRENKWGKKGKKEQITLIIECPAISK